MASLCTDPNCPISYPHDDVDALEWPVTGTTGDNHEATRRPSEAITSGDQTGDQTLTIVIRFPKPEVFKIYCKDCWRDLSFISDLIQHDCKYNTVQASPGQ